MNVDNAALPLSTEETDQLHWSSKKVKLRNGLSEEVSIPAHDNSSTDNGTDQKSKKSFRDIVMHESRTGEFLDDNYVSEDDSDGDVDLEYDPECPTIHLTNIKKRVLQQPWKFTVILKNEYERVLSDGPWMVAGHYLTVRQWRPNFDPDLAQIEKAMDLQN
ncbi:hypothetical protein GH714_041556 [Hevea brasiliensis]|uniref:DUF4283 domain-containing protein n=1 Tax=Hevea brasiliensis TaxID=3981 RepID=A0A6A6MUG1_HEVBR|nr:hypothetical protein GH714_041556 [Hevea brasiliensis]